MTHTFIVLLLEFSEVFVSSLNSQNSLVKFMLVLLKVALRSI